MTTLERLQALLQKECDVPLERLSPEARLEDLEIDSLRLIEILFSVEDAFAITVPAGADELRASLVTVGDLAAYVDSLIPKKESPGT